MRRARRRARPPCSRPPAGETWAPISMADRSSCAFALLHPRPGRCTSAAPARRSTMAARARPGETGRPAARSCCGSKIPTASARHRRTSSRSSTRCAGSGSTGTRGRSSSPQQRRAPRAGARASCSPAATRTTRNATAEDVRAYKQRHGADRGFRGEAGDRRRGAPARARRGHTVVDDVIRGEARVPEREHGRPGDRPRRRLGPLQLRGRGRRPRRRDHATSSAARTTSRTRPSSCSCSRRSARQPPRYAHLPLLHGPDGKKLSKRHGAASVQELRDAGYLPEAVDNYIALLGAGFASDEEHLQPAPSWPSASGSSASRRTRPCSTSASCATSTAATCASSASTS